MATSVFTPGENRVAFGLIDRDQSFLYGPTAVYFARRPNAEAQGPIPAPADSLVTAEAFRSRQAVLEAGRCFLLDREATAREADRTGMFLQAF